MIPIDKNARHVVRQFMQAHEKTEDLAVNMIRVGVNPYYAWMHVRGVKAEMLGDILDLGGRFEVAPGMPWQNNASIIDQISRDLVAPDSDTVLAFCEALGITPDQLARPRYGNPVASEIVEAAVKYVCHYREHRAMPKHLIEFLQDESEKANNVGDVKQNPFRESNAYILRDVEDAYAANHIFHDDAMLQEMEEPIETIFEMLENRVALYEEFLQDELITIADGIAAHESAWNEAHGDFWRVAHALAPYNQAEQWMRALYASILAKGIERTREILKAEPDSIYPLQAMWQQNFVHLRSGRIYRGVDLLDGAMDQYKTYNDATSALRAMKLRQEQGITDLLDFRHWRHTAETAQYLKAEAHRRHIRGYMDAEELGEDNTHLFEPVAWIGAKKPVLRP